MIDPTAETSYRAFLSGKMQLSSEYGFAPIWMPDFLFDFQSALVEWAIRKGRAAIFADCGLGKGPMALVWAENVIRHTNQPVLIVTPIAVGHQFLREGEKFGIECARSSDGKPSRSKITVTNYERLERFDPADFAGVVCDESSAIKAMDGKRRAIVTEFLRTLPYRLLCTATAAPNDYVELGTSSEALGELGQVDMLTRFFKNEQNTIAPKRTWDEGGIWRFKKHAETPFWRWVCSWARALRRPSDLGFSDERFALPTLIERETIVKTEKPTPGMLFALPAVGLREQRDEARRTIMERCETVARLVADTRRPAVIWCHLNREGDLLETMISDALQVSGSDSDEAKEEKFLAFSSGELRVLVTKQKIAGWGLNWQHCAHVILFPSHSFEGYYQAVRRCWRFGQVNPVTVDIVRTEGEADVMANLRRKSEACDRMFTTLVCYMNDGIRIGTNTEFPDQPEVPAWV